LSDIVTAHSFVGFAQHSGAVRNYHARIHRFSHARPPRKALGEVTGLKDEEVQLGTREIYVHFPAGIGASRLKIPATRSGTARNMNTIATLLALAGKS
jgi:uncharacterized protein (DUF1697 family)